MLAAPSFQQSPKKRVGFILKSYLLKEHHGWFNTLKMALGTASEDIDYSSSHSLHLTFGESAYFNQPNDQLPANININEDFIRKDFEALSNNLKLDSTSLGEFRIKSHRISDRGFVILSLASDKAPFAIAAAFRRAMSESHSSAALYFLPKRFYRGPIEDYDFHISIGKLKTNSVSERSRINKALSAYFETYKDTELFSPLRFDNEGDLVCSYGGQANRRVLCKAPVHFSQKPTSIFAPLYRAKNPDLGPGPGPNPGPYVDVPAPSKPTPAAHKELSVPNIKEALSLFFPEKQTRDIGVHLPHSEGAPYVIKFRFKQDRKDFCAKFKARFSGQSVGCCRYNKDDMTQTKVNVDESAMRTILSMTQPTASARMTP